MVRIPAGWLVDLWRIRGGDLWTCFAALSPILGDGVMERDVLMVVDGKPVTDMVIPAGAAGTAIMGVRTGDRPVREVTLIRGGENGRWLARLGLPVSAVIAFAVGMELLVLCNCLPSRRLV